MRRALGPGYVVRRALGHDPKKSSSGHSMLHAEAVTIAPANSRRDPQLQLELEESERYILGFKEVSFAILGLKKDGFALDVPEKVKKTSLDTPPPLPWL